NAVSFTPGALVTNVLAPGNGTVFYQFNGQAGDRYYFDGQPTSGFSYAPQSRLYGPLGNIIFSQQVDSDQDTVTLTQSGLYTLSVEGRVYDTHASGNYAFNLVPNPSLSPQPLFATNIAPDVLLYGESLQNDLFSFSFVSAANHLYLVHYSDSLTPPVTWKPL